PTPRLRDATPHLAASRASSSRIIGVRPVISATASNSDRDASGKLNAPLWGAWSGSASHSASAARIRGAHSSQASFLRCFWGDREGIGLWGHAEICYRSRACGVHVKNIGCRRRVMHAVIRSYSGKGTKALFDPLGEEQSRSGKSHPGGKGFR